MYPHEMRCDLESFDGSQILTGPFGRAAVLTLGSRLTAHAHAHAHLILKLSGPNQSFLVEGIELPLTDELGVAVNVWEEHAYLPKDQGSHTTYLALYLNTNWLKSRDAIFADCSKPGFFNHSTVRVDAKARQMAHDLWDLVESSVSQGDGASILISDLMQHFVSKEGAGNQVSRRLADYRIRRAVAAIHENCGMPYDFDALATASGLSRSRFNVLFKKTMGVGPGVYGNAIRLEAAVSALSSNARAQDVATSLGFSSPGNFNRFFQFHTGVPPATFSRSLCKLDG